MTADAPLDDATRSGSSRRGARRDAIVLLYQRDVTGLGREQLLENHERGEGRPPGRYTLDLVDGVERHRAELDAAIDAAAHGWSVERLAPLERNILRVAVLEMREPRALPAGVAIDEAVRAAKRFCQEEAAGLVNGILGRVVAEGVE